MKNSIEKLLVEITLDWKSSDEYQILKKAYDDLDKTDFMLCIDIMNLWPFEIKIGLPSEETENRVSTLDYYLLDERYVVKFKALSELCSELSEVFMVANNKLQFNATLSVQERQEIIDFIAANHNIDFHD